MKLGASITILAIALFAANVQGQRNMVCYFTSWSQYRPGIGKFNEVRDIDPYLCTHIVYAFISMQNSPQPTLKLIANDATLIGNIMKLKATNPNLKVTAAVGGARFDNTLFTKVCQSRRNMQHFSTAAVSFLRQYRFDGLAVDWEYPAQGSSPPQDKQRFTTFLQVLRRTFEMEAGISNVKPRLSLSAAVSAGRSRIQAGYEIAAVCQSLDTIQLMTYDLHGSWESVTDHNAPLLRSGASQHNANPTYDNTVANAVNIWINGGCPAQKILLGIPLYGRGFTLKNPNVFGYGASKSGGSLAGRYTRTAGLLSYYEICQMRGNTLTNQGVKAPVLVSGNQWIGYDDAESVKEKVKYLQSRGLGGAMIWSLDMDDFRGTCPGGVKYKLSKAIKQQLNSASTVSTLAPTTMPTSTTTRRFPTTTTTTTTATTTLSAGNTCQGTGDGFYTDSNDRSKFYRCVRGIQYYFACAAGLVFNDVMNTCTYP